MKEHQSPWYLFTGLILGLIFGVVYTWYISPVEYSNVAPSSLSSGYKNSYRIMIALSYEANHDLGRTLGRLSLLKDEDVRLALNSQSQQILSADGDEQEAQALAQLALVLNNSSAQMIYTQEAVQLESTPALEATSVVESIENTATVEKTVVLTAEPTFTPRPTISSTTEYSFPFVYVDSEDVCDPGLSKGLLQIYVNDKSGEGVPAVPIYITWDGGEEIFYTGLYPQFSMGYADYEMTAGSVYSLRVGEGGEAITGLISPECLTDDEEPYSGSLLLRFSQP